MSSRIFLVFVEANEYREKSMNMQRFFAIFLSHCIWKDFLVFLKSILKENYINVIKKILNMKWQKYMPKRLFMLLYTPSILLGHWRQPRRTLTPNKLDKSFRVSETQRRIEHCGWSQQKYWIDYWSFGKTCCHLTSNEGY